MATFTLSWTPNINSKVVAQRAFYRQKMLGGSFSDEGFDPPNDLDITANTTSISDLLYNTIYEFEIANICDDADEPIYNSNGIIEAIIFKCEPVNANISYDSILAYSSAVPADITKIRYSLYNEQNALLKTITNPVIDNYSEALFSDLDSEKIYIIKTQYYTYLNGSEVVSDCLIDNARTVKTAEYPACTPPLNLSVSVINI